MNQGGQPNPGQGDKGFKGGHGDKGNQPNR
jgi:hypothetical protein